MKQISEVGTLPNQEVVVKEVPPRLVVGLRKKVTEYNLIPILYQELCTAVPSSCLQPDPALPAAVIHYDSEFDESGMDIEMVVPISRQEKPRGQARIYQLEGASKMACLVHQGGLSEIPQAYQQLFSWIDANDYQVTGPNRDVYLQGMSSLTEEGNRTVVANDLITEVQVPVKRKPIPIFIRKFKEYPQMETKIVAKPSFTVVGMKYFGKNENNEIPQLWQVAAPRFNEIKHAKVPPYDSYGVCGELKEDGRFDYIAGVEVNSKADIPEGMDFWIVPEQTYVVFPCTLADIHKTYEYAHTEWLPKNEYHRADGPDFEYYDETFDPKDPDSLLYIYIPIENK
jgi:AraC family transcriptional regulator